MALLVNVTVLGDVFDTLSERQQRKCGALGPTTTTPTAASSGPHDGSCQAQARPRTRFWAKEVQSLNRAQRKSYLTGGLSPRLIDASQGIRKDTYTTLRRRRPAFNILCPTRRNRYRTIAFDEIRQYIALENWSRNLFSSNASDWNALGRRTVLTVSGSMQSALNQPNMKSDNPSLED